MDAAEAWLREHDAHYDRHAEAWPDLVGGEYVTPRREFPVGLTSELEVLVYGQRPLGDWVRPLDIERYCADCGRSFMPYKRSHAYCAKRCYQRAYMRERRKERAAP